MNIYNIKTITVGENVFRLTTDEATQYSSGLMSSGDKEKLDDIAEGATANEGTVKSIIAGSGLTGGTITESGTIALGASGAVAGNYGLTGSTVGDDGVTIIIPYFSIDAYGRITNAVNRTYTSRNTTYPKVSQFTDGLMLASDKQKIDQLTSITSEEISTIFASMTADYNPNIYDLTAITSDEISDIFSD